MRNQIVIGLDGPKAKALLELLQTLRAFLASFKYASLPNLFADAEWLEELVAGFESLLRKEIEEAAKE